MTAGAKSLRRERSKIVSSSQEMYKTRPASAMEVEGEVWKIEERDKCEPDVAERE